MIESGATTIWESWNLDYVYHSHNHPMFGWVSAWFYEYLGGIGIGENGSGFTNITINPQMVGDLEWVSTQYTSAQGEISTYYYVLNATTICLNVQIPCNSIATVTLQPPIFCQIERIRKHPYYRTWCSHRSSSSLVEHVQATSQAGSTLHFCIYENLLDKNKCIVCKTCYQASCCKIQQDMRDSQKLRHCG